MPAMTNKVPSQQIRSAFLSYFKRQGHSVVASSRLIPEGDDTLLFTNAGMNQFKNLFLGLEKRDYVRAVTAQKCVRAGGKHNDLENVGYTARHHTFFEMLGNFSFGDYFKKDAIHFAWELLTRELQIPKDRLYVTVFETDDEAANLWHVQEGIPRDRISRFGEADNFWRMGDVGPCGPCSEIFYDHGPEAGCGKPDCKVGCACDRFVEIWNLVFMQFEEDGKGGRKVLPKPSVDTGGGLERWSAVLQGQANNYNTDLFIPLIEFGAHLTKVDPRQNTQVQTALRVIADHARATAFLMTDGVIPSNEGRGYVLRRIMRRAIRYARGLSKNTSVFPAIVQQVIEQMKEAYPELGHQQKVVLPIVQKEEERFLLTLDHGTELLNQAFEQHRRSGKKLLDGALVFRLYDTFGFPVDLTRLMAHENQFTVDEADFEERMKKAKALSQSSWKGQAISSDEAHLVKLAQGVAATHFSGYEATDFQGKLLALSNGTEAVKELRAGERGLVVLDRSSFYAEGGGQVGDKGWISTPTGAAQVLDCQKRGQVHLHFVEVLKGSFRVGEVVSGNVNVSERRDTAANHSATHLLHAALREVLGHHVTQAGSLVESLRLRFDFTHPGALTTAQVERIEELVNQQILEGHKVDAREMAYTQALEFGALALFGEKYGDQVRVLKMGEFSTELCGGTHVSNTSEIKVFKIVSEGAVSSGVRRIEALTGRAALMFLVQHTRQHLAVRSAAGLSNAWEPWVTEDSASGVQVESVIGVLDKQKEEVKKLERELKQSKEQSVDVDQILASSKLLESVKFICLKTKIDDREALSQISDRLRDKAGSAVVILAGSSVNGSSFPILLSVTKDLAKKLSANDILREFLSPLGGKGGGRPDFAQGAAPRLDEWGASVARVETWIKAKVSGSST